MRPSLVVRPPSLTASLGIAAVLHGALLLSGTFKRTYDAYVHIFFADHYARDWFSTWETRWYTGFTITSYPPGTHQLMGLLSRVLGLHGAFFVVQLCAIVVLVIGVRRFSRIWVSDEAADWAALLAVFSTSIAEAVHVFGQLPTTFSLGLLLNALPSADRWLRTGERRALIVGVAAVAATTAGHHVTTLFGSVFFLGPVVARVVVDEFRTPLPDEEDRHRARVTPGVIWPLVARRLRRLLPVTVRLAILGPTLIMMLLLVVLPYWLWSHSDPISQVPIPHGSRSNFLEDTAAGLAFWLVPWGPLVLLVPFALIRGAASRAWPLAASVGLLALLGTGGTTPIPKMLLGGAFDILTLDRFTFWATIAILPIAGRLITSLTSGRIGAVFEQRLGGPLFRGTVVATFAAVACGFLFAASLGQFRPLQPDPIDPDPMVEFLAKDQHDRWRFLTLGFGDQMAWLSANTTATTVDGNYHSARRLPELTSRSVERLEGAKFRGVPGIGSLQQFVTTPQRYNLKFVFSNDTFYDPLLFSTGWHRLGELRNGIMVWERADIPPLPDRLPIRELPTWQRLMWGLLPMTAIVSAALALTWFRLGEPLPRRLRVALAARPAPLEQRLTAWLQRRLDRPVSRLVGAAPATPLAWPIRQRGHRLLQRLDPTTNTPPRRLLQVAFVALVVIAGVGIGRLFVGEPASADPSTQVVAYYDDLDFGRFESSWARLDPDTRVGLDQHLLDLSVKDGLVTGYAKLDTISIDEVRFDGPRAEVDVSLYYLTSVRSYEVTRTHLVVQRDGDWYLWPDPVSEDRPPDQFVRRTDVEYLDLGRRSATVDNTDYNDVLDRPRVEVLDSRLVLHDNRWYVVGQLTNVDVDPADVTVSSRLLAADDSELVAYDGGQATIQKVRPGETVPFRVDFEDVAGAADVTDPSAGDFDPEAATPVILEQPVASYELSVRAVVTGRDLERLAVEDVTLDDDGTLDGRLQNDLLTTATIPVLTAAQLDSDGSVMWVDVAYLAEAIRPQRHGLFSVELTDTDAVQQLDVPAILFDNGRTDQVDASFRPPPTLAFTGQEVAGVRLTAVTFVRELAP